MNNNSFICNDALFSGFLFASHLLFLFISAQNASLVLLVIQQQRAMQINILHQVKCFIYAWMNFPFQIFLTTTVWTKKDVHSIHILYFKASLFVWVGC